MAKVKKAMLITMLIVLIITPFAAKAVKGYINGSYVGKTLNKNFDVKIKSGNLSTDYEISQVLEDIKKLDLNTINLPITIDIKSLNSNDMEVNKQSKEKAIRLIKSLPKRKINVILEPYPWIDNGSLYETEWNPTDINTFFWNWKTKVLKELIEDIAVPYNVNAIVIASNFRHMEYAEGYWCDTIEYVRGLYKGLITYKTNWWYTAEFDKKTVDMYNSKLNNKLFSKVDFISIGAYFELTDKDTNNAEDLAKTINKTSIYGRNQNIKKELQNFNDKWKKPVFFGELGFPRRNGAAMYPWNPMPSNKENNIEQANCFEAYKENFENESWILGFSIFAIGQQGKDKNYYPSNESVKVIKSWYSK